MLAQGANAVQLIQPLRLNMSLVLWDHKQGWTGPCEPTLRPISRVVVAAAAWAHLWNNPDTHLEGHLEAYLEAYLETYSGWCCCGCLGARLVALAQLFGDLVNLRIPKHLRVHQACLSQPV